MSILIYFNSVGDGGCGPLRAASSHDISSASSCTARTYLRFGLPRLRLAPAACWPVGLRIARWIAATPFLKHAGHAHGNVGDFTIASSATLALPRQAFELCYTVVHNLQPTSQRTNLLALLALRPF